MTKLALALSVFLFSFSHFTSASCGSNPPEKYEDCFNRDTSSESKCCYLVYNHTERLCQIITKEEREKDDLYYTYNNKTYEMSCDISSVDSTGLQCGVSNPKEASDCHNSSLTGNKCCFYSNDFTNTKLCFFLGYEYTGNLTTYDSEIIDCNAMKLKASIVYLISFWMIMLMKY